MKKVISLILTLMLVLTAVNALADFNEDSEINVISREDGSGTRGAFIELTGVLEKNEAGDKVDRTYEDAEFVNGTSVVITSVEKDKNSIGYISMGSMNETVKCLKVDGIDPTPENVKNGEYKLARPFNIALSNKLENSDKKALAEDFIKFILSNDGQAIVESEGCIAATEGTYEPSGLTGELEVGGSTSVTPAMQVLAEKYSELNEGVQINVQGVGSTAGMTGADEGLFDIGMASRELKDSELEKGLVPVVIAIDGITMIVNQENTCEDITMDEICKIYIGETTTWAEVIK